MADDERLLLAREDLERGEGIFRDVERAEHLNEDSNGPQVTRILSSFSLDKIWHGPARPRKLHITLFWKRVQLLPEQLLTIFPDWIKFGLFCSLFVSWVVANIVLSSHGYLAISRESTGEDTVRPLFCGRNHGIWAGPGSECGLNASGCIDQVEGRILSFRCPPNCGSAGWTYEHWSVGNYSAMREPVVIGGPDVYRGDSFICVAALHAGIISPYTGGCGQLQWIGSHSNFVSTPSATGKFDSLAYDSEFPLNFRFLDSKDKFANCEDNRVLHIGVNIVFMLLAAYCIPTSVIVPAWFFFVVGMFGFWTVVLASHPPARAGTPSANAELVSLGFRRLLPCFLGLFFIYIVAARPQLEGMRASLSRALFWGSGYIIGILENYVFASLPIDRLIVSDLNSQHGAWLTLAIISIALVFIIVGQAYSFWLMGEFRKCLKLYFGIFGALVVLALWPGQTLRLHHYFFALLLIPGTKPRTTCSLFFQGLLTGLYVSGVARWDFDSVLQTASQLSRGEAPSDILADPWFVDPEQIARSLVVSWKQRALGSINGYSITINDIERVREVGTAEADAEGIVTYSFDLAQWISSHFAEGAPEKWYVRVASAALGPRKRARVGKYSEALVLNSGTSND